MPPGAPIPGPFSRGSWRSSGCPTPNAPIATPDPAPCARPSVRVVPHVVRERVELLAEVGADRVGHRGFGERAVHAPEPLVALAGADREGQVPRAEPRMPVALDVELRAPRPSGEEHEQL